MRKNVLMALMTLVVFGLVAGAALACQWDGWSGHRGWGSGPGYRGNTATGYQQFNNETAQWREELAARRGEYNALMARENPDPERAAQLQKEMSRLHDQIRSKAQAYDMPPASRSYDNHSRHGGWNYCGGYCW